MITRILVMECDFCPRWTRIKGAEVTEAALVEKSLSRGWTRKPDPRFPLTSPIDRCPECELERTRAERDEPVGPPSRAFLGEPVCDNPTCACHGPAAVTVS